MMPGSPATPVGALAAQMNSYLKSIVTKVVSCEKVEQKAADTKKGDEQQMEQFSVVCEDSVLFPEGGGQPSDRGTLNGDVNVVNVQRVKDMCVLTTDKAIEVGAEVKMEVDWARRMDHMQHHSAQHLLTAVVEEQLNLPTTSWALTSPFCFICVPTAKISAEDVQKVEDICNDLIFKATKVERRTYESRAEVPPARSRSIPEDFSGPIRLIDIDGVDVCACCGTHVNTLGELHMIKILHQEPKGNTCRLHFVTGNRLSSAFSEMYDRERSIAKECGCAPSGVLTSIKKRSADGTAFEKKSKKLMTELVTFIAPQVAEKVVAFKGQDEAKRTMPNGKPAPFTFVREDGDMDFIMTVATHVTKSVEEYPTCVIAAGDLKKENEGQFVIVGKNEDDVKEIGELVKSELDGKGAMSKQGFRGKCNMKKWKQFVKGLGPKKEKPAPAAKKE